MSILCVGRRVLHLLSLHTYNPHTIHTTKPLIIVNIECTARVHPTLKGKKKLLSHSVGQTKHVGSIVHSHHDTHVGMEEADK